MMLRVEGIAVLLAAVALYARSDAGWGMFAALFLLPDVSFLGYLGGARWGAAAYNAVHSYVAPAALAAAGAFTGTPIALAMSLIWFAHIGFDRALGYGLKYASGFHATHLGRIGRSDPW